MSKAGEWLEAHATGAPDALRERMLAALAGEAAAHEPDAHIPDAHVPEVHVPEAPVPEALADAALAQLATVLQAPSPRGAAIGLLAADALLTAAFEAAADSPDSIRQLEERYDPARLTALLAS